MEICVTINPKKSIFFVPGNWKDTHLLQHTIFMKFMRQYTDRLFCFKTEIQGGTNNLHWHGAIQVLSASDLLSLRQSFGYFGRTEIATIRNDRKYYDYMFKDNGTCIYNTALKKGKMPQYQ